MPATPAAPQAPLDPAVLRVMLVSVLEALPRTKQDSPEQAAERYRVARLTAEAMHPRDEVEAMLVARCVAAHNAAMVAFRRAGNSDLPLETVNKLLGKALSLSRLAGATLRTLQQIQKQAPLPAALPAATRAPASTPASAAARQPATATTPPAPETAPVAPSPADENKNPMHREPVPGLDSIAPPPGRMSLRAALASTSAIDRLRLPGATVPALTRRAA